MKLNVTKLKNACFEVARNTMWDTRPIDVADIESVANRFFEIAKDHEEFIVGQGQDPNLITRAVLYLAHSHAIPPMRDNIQWYSDMLATLVELACPNVRAIEENEAFYHDIEEGIEIARSEYKKALQNK